MKIALVDNMNNNLFALARYFRALGVDADLYLIPKSGHIQFTPENDTWLDLSQANWVKFFPFSYKWTTYLRPIRKKLRDTFSGYDRVIACGPAIGLLHHAQIKIDLFVPYGADLFNVPFFSFSRAMGPCYQYPIRLLFNARQTWLQRKGIKAAAKITSNTNWKIAEDALERLGCSAINLPRVMVYKEVLPDNAYDRFRFFKNHDFVLLSPTRHLWKTNAEPMPDFEKKGGAKRNDHLIRAFARVVKSNLFAAPVMVLCHYGADVLHSKNLIKALEIEPFVVWLPLISRKELVAGISMASVIADQFREGMSATSSGITNEALAYGTPIITNTEGAIEDKDDPYYGCPIHQALNEDEIYQHILRISKNSEQRDEFRANSIAWFDEHLGQGLAARYLDLLGVPFGLEDRAH